MDLPPFDPRRFAPSALYSTLCDVVAGNAALRELAGHARAGQQPAFALFGAVHQLLLRGADHELREFYPSVVGERARPPAGVGPAFASFCAGRRDELVEIVSSRLVQTNHVRRAVGLRVALATIAPLVSGPVDLIEVGSSAGLLLGFDRYAYEIRDADGASRSYGDAGSPVRLATELRGPLPLPDLDVLPDVASRTGVDLHPIDAADPDSREWLRALVWPEDEVQRRLLDTALDLVAKDPPPTVAGDAVDVLPELAAALPSGRDRVVFHCATRMHVPQDRLAAFDAAVAAVGRTGRLWQIAIEAAPDPDPRAEGSTPGAALQVDAPSGRSQLIAVVDGHLRWIEPVPHALTRDGVT